MRRRGRVPVVPAYVEVGISVDVLNRHPEYTDLFPIGSSLAMWATWGA